MSHHRRIQSLVLGSLGFGLGCRPSTHTEPPVVIDTNATVAASQSPTSPPSAVGSLDGDASIATSAPHASASGSSPTFASSAPFATPPTGAPPIIDSDPPGIGSARANVPGPKETYEQCETRMMRELQRGKGPHVRCAPTSQAEMQQGAAACRCQVIHMRGRPLVVEGRARVAALGDAAEARRWATVDGASLELDGETRARLGSELAAAALEEHASIAAFARTICELMALGAPAWLVERTSAALADEIRHATDTASWARRLGATAVSPGALPAAVAPLRQGDRATTELLVDVFRGGCVGETLAAARALDDAACAPTEELRRFFEGLSADEARHAALAFDTVRWLVAVDPALCDVVARERTSFMLGASESDAALLGSLFAVFDGAGVEA